MNFGGGWNAGGGGGGDGFNFGGGGGGAGGFTFGGGGTGAGAGAGAGAGGGGGGGAGAGGGFGFQTGGGGGGGWGAGTTGAASAATAGGWGAPATNAGGWGAPAANAGGWGAPAANAGGWGAPAAPAAAAPGGGGANAFDRRDQMSISQRVIWIAHMQNITQQMSAQLEAVRKSQEKRFQDISSSLQDVKKAQDNLQANFEVSVVSKLPAAKLMHLKLAHRLVVVMKQIELLRLRNRNVSTLEEEVWRSKLQSIKKELDRPDQYSGRLKEVSSRVKLQQDNGAALNGADYEAIDQDALETTALFLEEQREGLEKLLAVLNTDIQDVRLIETASQGEINL